MKNRESQQFFQCEICDHFFQSESILEKHIKGHQVEKLARFKVLPSLPSSPSRHKRKHSKKKRKKSEKANKEYLNTDKRSVDNSKNLVDTINANDVDEMHFNNVKKTEGREKAHYSEISSTTNQRPPLYVNKKFAQSQPECQSSNAPNSGPLNQQTNSPILTSSNLVSSIPSSPGEKIQEIENLQDIPANPEIEQAVASISGPHLGEIEHSLQDSNSDGIETDNDTMLQLSSGTLEIEKAVNSILGEAEISNDENMMDNNAIIFDIKQNAENKPSKPIVAGTDECDPCDEMTTIASNIIADLEDMDTNVLNGAVTDSFRSGIILNQQQMSENIRMEIAEDDQMENKDQTAERRTENISIDRPSSLVTHQVRNVENRENSDTFRIDSALLSSNTSTQAQDMVSTNNLNGIDGASYQNTNKTLVNTSIDLSQPVEHYNESLETNNVVSHDMSRESSKVHSNVDIPHSQFHTSKDSLEKVPNTTNQFDSKMMPNNPLNDLKISNIVKMNNGDVSNHE